MYLINRRKDPIIKIVSKLAMSEFVCFPRAFNMVREPTILQNNRRNDQ